MATYTKAPIAIQASTSRAAGAASTDSAWIDVSTAIAIDVTGKIANGATGPSTACSFIIETADDGSGANATEYYRVTAVTTNSETSIWPKVPLPDTTLFFRTRFSGNVGQAVTVEAFGHKVTAIG
jgi:hypothetical protein